MTDFTPPTPPSAPSGGMPEAPGVAGPTPPAQGDVPQGVTASGPVPGAPGPGAPAQSESARLGTRAIAITVTVLGAIGLVLSGTGVAIATVGDSVRGSHDGMTETLDVTGVTALDVDVESGALTVVFGAVDEAQLITSRGEPWRMEASGSTLSVSSSDDSIWGDGWGWVFGWDDESKATLTLPEGLAGADLDVDLAAGELIADGEFRDVVVGMGAGRLEVEGSAETVQASIGAGQAILELSDVREADVGLSAGHLIGDLTGTAPERIVLSVSAGAIDLALPDEEYAVDGAMGLGEVDTHDLRIGSASEHDVSLDVSAGRIDLRTNG